MLNKKKICITDDHKIVAEGISSFLVDNEEFELVSSSTSGEELLNKLKKRRTPPDILLLDIKMQGLSGIQLAKIIKCDHPDIKIVFLSSNNDKESIDEAVNAGGCGYLLKDIAEEEFLFAMKKIASGENYFSTSIQQTVFNNYTNNSKTANNDNILSNREAEIIKLIAEGLSQKNIAEQLFISARTVETHKKNILEKLNLKSTIDLVKYAILNGIISI